MAIVLVAATVLAAGCKKDQGAEGYVTLNATIDNQTKMHIVDGQGSDNNNYLHWDNGDEIFINGHSYPVLPSTDNPANASITVRQAEDYYAVYPASLVATGASIASNSVAIVLPATQTYSIINGHQRVDVPMVAYTEGTSLQFHNICSVVRVVVKNTNDYSDLTIDRIVVKAETALLSGAANAYIDTANRNDDRVSMTSGSHTVTLSIANAVTVPSGDSAAFDIVVPPFNNDNVTITLYDDDDAYAEIEKANVSLPKSTIASVKMDVQWTEDRWVNLGLPSGLLWATCNVGATSPEEYGDYFAWGETSTKTYYSWDTYTWCNGTSNSLTKYCTNSSYGYNGFTDNLTTLLPTDDAATANYGGRMPTTAEWLELMNHTTNVWTNQNGVYGRRFTSNTNGRSIFLPTTNVLWNDGPTLNEGAQGCYWSSSLNESDQDEAMAFAFIDEEVSNTESIWRFVGMSVRAVRDNPNNK